MSEKSSLSPRRPSPQGMGAIPTLPIFFKLQGRDVVLAGASLPAVWKAELLAAAGARVQVFDPDPCADMLLLKDRLSDAVTLHTRDWDADDLSQAAIAIGALEGSHAETFRLAAKRAGVPVNIIDVPELCDFQFGTIVERSPLVIAISTDGAAPVFGQALRTRIEALLPKEVQAWAQAAKDWRPALQALALSFAARHKFWEVFADFALGGQGAMPDERTRQTCLDAARVTALIKTGSLDYVGLGPGDADLVTLRAVRALQSADVIVHEREVGAALLGLGRREARTQIEDQDNRLTAETIRALVNEGKRIAWAGLGDASTCPKWLDRRSEATVESVNIISGIRCASCPNGCAARQIDQCSAFTARCAP